MPNPRTFMALFVLSLVCFMPSFAAEIPECLKKLAKVDTVSTAFGGRGGQSWEFALYKEAVSLKMEPMGKELNWLTKNGTPAARVYAAFIAWEKDYPAGLARFENLKTDTSKVRYRSGCEVTETSVSEIADEFLKKHRYLDFPTSVFCKMPMAVESDKNDKKK